VVGDDDHRVLVEEAVGPAAGVHHALDLAVGLGDRGHLGVRAVLVRVRVVVGQRQQQEVEEVVLDEVRADAAGVLVAEARHAELAAALRAAARVQVGVEELLRTLDRAAEERLPGDPGQRAVARDLVLVAPAVHEVGRAGGANPASSSVSNTVSVSGAGARCSSVDGVDDLAVDAVRRDAPKLDPYST
jgi:hypothetical protein